MSSSIYASELVEEADAGDTDRGFEMVRVFQVVGLTGTASSKMYAALQTTGIPQRGDAHPDGSLSDLKCTDRRVRVDSSEKMKVICTYRDESTVETMEFGLLTVTSFKDYAGADITVTGPDGSVQTVDYQKQVPVTTLTYRQRESSNPKSTADTYRGKINSSSWKGYAAHTVLCLDISSETRDGGAFWDVTYRFQVLPDTWDVLVYHKDPETDRPTAGIVSGVGYKRVQVFVEDNFGALPF